MSSRPPLRSASLWRRRRWLVILVPVALLGIFGWRAWQGPLLPAYELETRPLVQTVVATGRVLAPTRVQIGSEITASVTERRVQEGDVVAAGDLLAVLRSDDLAARVREAAASLEQLERTARPLAEAARHEAEAQLAQAARETRRRQSLLEQKLIAREAFEQAQQAEITARAAAETASVKLARLSLGDADEAVLRERLAAAKAALAKTEIRASVAGTVLSRDVEPGDIVQPGKVLFEIAREGVTEILVPLDEKNLSAVALGQTALCVADAYPSESFAARVSLIAPKIDPLRGTVDVRLIVDPAPTFLLQDMTVSVNIETARRDSALAIPNDAVQTDAGGHTTVILVRDGHAERVPVNVGLRGLTQSEVTRGLSAGDVVLADPSFSGGRVRASRQAVPTAARNIANRDLPLPPE